MSYNSYRKHHVGKSSQFPRGSQRYGNPHQKKEYESLCNDLSNSLNDLENMLTKNTDKLYDLIEKILKDDEKYYRALFGNTSKTAYRRVHELLVSILDQLEYLVKQNYGKVPIELAKAKTLIHHQAARRQFQKGECAGQKSDALNYLDEIIAILHSNLKNNRDPSSISNLVSSTRTLLDAFVVIVEKNARN